MVGKHLIRPMGSHTRHSLYFRTNYQAATNRLEDAVQALSVNQPARLLQRLNRSKVREISGVGDGEQKPRNTRNHFRCVSPFHAWLTAVAVRSRKNNDFNHDGVSGRDSRLHHEYRLEKIAA
jgi:hypothetical protein